ncbi:MAG: FAD-linked oxidase C-terminal domain-containing protein [Dethiobacteria bacterium]|nr:FAD-linked oxidase C-terminal domain-containing protein [Dethiobacteria bacterium]
MKEYKKLTHADLEVLQAIVGIDQVIFDDPQRIEPYSHDEVADPAYACMPAVVIKPASAVEISAVLKMANLRSIPVTPRGAGSGLSGGAVPACGGILLSTERMNRILEIDHENLIAVLEPGVITNDFNNEVQKEGLFFAGYPMSLEMCFIGGNVAENAGGGRAIKYGVTGRYITGLEVVMPTGEICTFGGKRVKDVTGYNMVQLMVGSEGTLGIFTKIMIKLMPLPRAKIDMMVLFPDVQSAIDVVPLVMTKTGITPTGIEFMDKLSLDTTSEYLGEKKRYQDAGAVLIIEVDGNESDLVREDCLKIGDLCLDHGALDAFVAEGPADQEKIWKVRRHVAAAFKAISPEQSLEDIVVPVSAIPRLIPRLKLLSEKYGVLIPCYGHAGDGNLHATIVKMPETTMEEWREILPRVLSELYLETRELGGTISGEHGIGHKRKKYLPLVLTEDEIEAMRKIKRALDPLNILNPGKIFDLD